MNIGIITTNTISLSVSGLLGDPNSRVMVHRLYFLSGVVPSLQQPSQGSVNCLPYEVATRRFQAKI